MQWKCREMAVFCCEKRREEGKMSRMAQGQLTDDPVLNRVLNLLKEKGHTEKELAEYLGLSSSSFTGWKYWERKTFMQYTEPMAEYLNVSVNYLLYGKDEEINEGTISPAEMDLLKRFRQMNPEQRECMVRTSKCFVKL